MYRDVLLRRWQNRLGRTMWEFPSAHADLARYLVLGLGATDQPVDATVPSDRSGLIAYGPLLSDRAAWLGTVSLVQAPDANAAGAVLTADRYASLEVHNWDFGGRPS